MDLVGWSISRFEEIRTEFGQFAAKLDIHDLATAFGLPCALSDRPDRRSDEGGRLAPALVRSAIASLTGLSGKTIAAIRRR